jgi:D-cysteine desulfhydrase
VRLLERTSNTVGTEIWAKLEEECGAWGGNKVRKLEYMFHELRAAGVERFAAWGAATSNWVAAAAWHGSKLGFEVGVGLGGHLPDDYRRIYETAGCSLVVFPHIGLAPVAAAIVRARLGWRASILPVGGSGGSGDIGSTRAGIEVARSIASGEIPEPHSVFVAAGTCGTVAGLSVGMGLAGCSSTVVAVKVADWPYATPPMIERRRRNIAARLGTTGADPHPPAPVRFEDRFLGRGYAHPTREARAAALVARRDGLHLDGTYAAKAFAALIATARNGDGPLLFVHTSPGPPPVR